MVRSHWILPRADSSCGKAFHADRKSAEGHRIVLEFWNQATGRVRTDSKLVSYRCKRCGGFHLGRKKVDSRAAAATSPVPGATSPLTAPREETAHHTVMLPRLAEHRAWRTTGSIPREASLG